MSSKTNRRALLKSVRPGIEYGQCQFWDCREDFVCKTVRPNFEEINLFHKITACTRAVSNPGLGHTVFSSTTKLLCLTTDCCTKRSNLYIILVLQTRDPSRQMYLNDQITILDSSAVSCGACQLNRAVRARNAPDLTICYAGSIGTHLRAKVQPHAPRLLHAACTQALCHSLAEANVAISLAATCECSSCQCLSASALLVVFPVACPYSSLFVTAFRGRRIVVSSTEIDNALQNSPRGLL